MNVLKAIVVFNGIIGLFSIGIFYLIYGVDYSTHKMMTKGRSDKQAVGTYYDFVRHFSIQKWERESGNSFFNYSDDSQYHASIVKFHGVGMIMKSTIHWFLVTRYIKRLGVKSADKDHWKMPLHISKID